MPSRPPIPLWRYRGQERPPWALEPGPGQESVWDYPRPPRLEPDARCVVVRVGSHELARSERAIRILETASPPTFYLPPEDVDLAALEAASGGSHCEWKGTARYFDYSKDGVRLEAFAWSYPDPFPEFEAIRDFLSFYPARAECLVDGERVRPQPGGFYGGWLTDEIVGPVKGDPGSSGW